MRNVILILSALALLAFPSVVAEDCAEAETAGEGTATTDPGPQAETEGEPWDGGELVTVLSPDVSPVLALIGVEVEADPKELIPSIIQTNCFPDLSPCTQDIVCEWDGGYGGLPVRVPPNGIGIMVGPPARGFGPWFGPYHGYSISTDGGC